MNEAFLASGFDLEFSKKGKKNADKRKLYFVHSKVGERKTKDRKKKKQIK